MTGVAVDTQAAGDVEPVGTRHTDVEEYDIGRERSAHRQSRIAVSGYTDHVRLWPQGAGLAPQAVAEQEFIVVAQAAFEVLAWGLQVFDSRIDSDVLSVGGKMSRRAG